MVSGPQPWHVLQRGEEVVLKQSTSVPLPSTIHDSTGDPTWLTYTLCCSGVCVCIVIEYKVSIYCGNFYVGF